MNKIIHSMLYILYIVFLIGCSEKVSDYTSASLQVESSQDIQEYAINVSYPVRDTMVQYILVNGNVQSASVINVIPETSGIVRELRVKKGSVVQRDTILARIDPSRPGIMYEWYTLRSPINGMITNLSIAVGDNVSQTMSVAEVSTTNDLEIIVNIPERYIDVLTIGQQAMIQFDAFANEYFKAAISEISPVLDKNTRTLEVSLKFIGNAQKIRDGMFARVRLIIKEHKNVLIIPEQSIVNRFEQDIIFLVNDDQKTVSQHKVTIGLRIDGLAEVLSGVTEDDMIVIAGQKFLQDGAQVRIIENTTFMNTEL